METFRHTLAKTRHGSQKPQMLKKSNHFREFQIVLIPKMAWFDSVFPNWAIKNRQVFDGFYEVQKPNLLELLAWEICCFAKFFLYADKLVVLGHSIRT